MLGKVKVFYLTDWLLKHKKGREALLKVRGIARKLELWPFQVQI